MTNKSILQNIFSGLIFVSLAAGVAFAQATGFTYQGRLNASGNPANGTYEMQFQLFDSSKGGGQVGPTLTDSSVVITNGIFTTTLDFGASFDGSARFLEIGVRSGGSPDPFTLLSPRQAINYVPHAIRSLAAGASDTLSAACVDCVTSSQVQTLDGAKITGEIPTLSIPTGSDNYIQNASVPRPGRKLLGQPAASLNIGGNATVGSMDVNGPVSLAAIGAPAAAPAGQGRIYFDSGTNKVRVSENGAAFVDLVGATGVSGSGTVNSIPLFSGATTLGSSLISQSGGSVLLPAAVSLAATASGNNITFGSPNSGTGMTISGSTTRADMRLDSAVLRLAVGPAGAGPPGNGIGIDATTVTLPAAVSLAATASGNNVSFGSPNSGTGMTIGGPTTRADVRLDGTVLRLAAGPAGVGPPGNGIGIDANTVTLPSSVSLATTASGNNVSFGSPNTETGMTISGAGGRADLRYNGTLKLVNGAGGIPPATNGIAINILGNVGIGTTTPQTKLEVVGTTKTSILQITGGSDLAENFEITEGARPGMVVAISPRGHLTIARGAYNARVAGVISGANNLSAGMILPNLAGAKRSSPVALNGRVWVYADAMRNPIKPGDLLTTSNTPGHAMKAFNYQKAQGAILGKAMTELKSGIGLVLVLVTLQ